MGGRVGEGGIASGASLATLAGSSARIEALLERLVASQGAVVARLNAIEVGVFKSRHAAPFQHVATTIKPTAAAPPAPAVRTIAQSQTN